MKKVVALFVLICLSFSMCSASYAETRFSELTDDELLAAQTELHEELLSRGLIRKIVLPAGIYEAGVDIPVGKYILTDAEHNRGRYPNIEIWRNKAEWQEDKALGYIFQQTFNDSGSCMIALDEGNILVLDGSSFNVEKYSLPSF